MAKSERIKALETGLREIMKPALEAHGFAYRSRARSFSRSAGECIHIIEFQPGVRSAEGTFAVNLAVYHPIYHDPSAGKQPNETPREYDCLMEFRQRLGALRETWRTRIFNRLLRDKSGWLSWWLTTPADKWWRLSWDSGQVRSSLKEVLHLIETRGLPWFNAKTDVEKMQHCHSEIMQRIRGAS